MTDLSKISTEDLLKMKYKTSSERYAAPPEFEPPAGENVGGIIGSIGAGFLPLPLKIVASPILAGIGGMVGEDIQKLGNDQPIVENIPPLDFSGENIREAMVSGEQGGTFAPHERTGEISPFIRQAGFEVAGQAASPVIGAAGRKIYAEGAEFLAKRLRPQMVAGAKEMQEGLLKQVDEAVLAKRISPQEAQKLTFTIGQLSNPATTQKFLEDMSQHGIFGKGIAELKAKTAPFIEEELNNMVSKITSGIRPSPDTISAPVRVVNPLKKTGIKTPVEAGVMAGEEANLGLRAFKDVSEQIANRVSGMSQETFKGGKIVDITDITNNIFTEAKDSKYFNFIGKTPEGKNIQRTISDVIEPYAKGATRQVRDKSGHLIDMSAMPKEVIEQLGGNERTLVSYDEAINLYRQINNAAQTVEKTAKGEKSTLKNIFGQLRDDLSNSMQIGAVENNGSKVHDAFLAYNDWYKKGIEPFQTDVAEKLLDNYKQTPAEILKVINSPNASVQLENIRQITGKNADEVIRTMKDSYVENLYNVSKKLDPITKQEIADPVAIRKAINDLDPTAKKILFKSGEIPKIEKSIDEGVARIYSKNAITNPVYIGDFVVDTPSNTLKYIKSANAEQELSFIRKTLPKDEVDDIMKETSNRWIESLTAKAKKENIFTKQMVTDNEQIMKAVESLTPAMKKLMFGGREAELEAFKTAVRNGLITQAPSSWGHIGSFAIGYRQAAALGSLGTGTASAITGHGRLAKGLTAIGTVLILGPAAVRKVFTNPDFVNLVLKIERPTLEQIPKKTTYIKMLYNFLKEDKTIAAELRLLDMSNRESNEFPVEPKRFPLQKAGKQ